MSTEMKNSGVEWIEEIPTGWEIKRISDLFQEKNDRGSSAEVVLTVSIENGILPQTEYEALLGRRLSKPTQEKDNYKHVEKGDFAYNKMRMWQGAVAISNYDGVVSPAYIVFKSSMDIVPRFFLHQFKSEVFIAQSNSNSHGIVDDQNSLRFEDFRAMTVLTPSFSEQKAIADFLDYEAALIDKRLALIEKKQALLSELKKSVIYEAVTKGLDKSAVMKDSGVEWIGKIPFTWSLARMKDAGRFNTGRDHKHISEGTVPVYGSSNQSFAGVAESLCKRDALAIGRKGTVDSPYVIKAPFWAVDTCMYNVVSSNLFSFSFLSYWMQIIPWATLSTQTALPSLTQTAANNAIVAQPPVSEQERISQFLNKEIVRIDKLVFLLNRQKTLLKEQREALIHEVVTGKRRVI